MGDVAGKGMPAALLMALLQGSLRTLITAGLRGPELVSKLNAHLCANIPTNRLITFFYGELDTGSGALRYINAGHNPPVLIRAGGGLEHLAATGVALGVMPGATFEAMCTEIEPGDRLFLYTDGATEAFNRRDEEYGEERLQAYLLSHRDASHQDLIDGLTADILRFCGPVRLKDDMTFLSLSRER
jgi:sigma-B regulation protein RsbU (phosphoserine phosphatase)